MTVDQATPNNDYVQHIIVFGPASHEDVIKLSAEASVKAYRAYDEKTDAWQFWLDGMFTKHVRRCKNKRDMEVIFGIFKDSAIVFGDCVVVATTPFTRSKLIPEIRSCQLSHFERDRTGNWGAWDFDKPGIVCINKEIEMSTGKMAAQAAHGMFILELMYADQVEAGVNFTDDISIFNRLMEQENSLCIRDAGLTEIAPDTLTVVAGFV